MKNRKPFHPDYKRTEEFLIDLARWYASQDILPENEELYSQVADLCNLDDFRKRVFSFMVGSSVGIEPEYWFSKIGAVHQVSKIEGNYYEAVKHIKALSAKHPEIVFKLVEQYVSELKTFSRRVALFYDGDVYRA